ncbi:hypothetical protein [Halarchaeum sp. P4]|uniref:hypothetical protein n=1 Tax=Halarchaeum sp. P4 TaxID=3421639 RepID=UPI003EB6E7A6
MARLPRPRLTDSVLLSTPVVVLLAAYALPAAVKRTLAYHPAEPTVLGLLANAVVHFTPTHLVASLVGYAVLAPLCWYLCVHRARRPGVFRAVHVGVCLLVPPAAALAELPLAWNALTYGFSPVVTAYVGFLPLAATLAITVRCDRVRLDHAPVYFLGGLALAAAAVGRNDPTALPVAGVAALLAAPYALSLARALPRDFLAHAVDVPPVAALGVFAVAPLVAYPADPVVGDGAVVNLYSHFVGYALGFLVPYVAIRIARADTPVVEATATDVTSEASNDVSNADTDVTTAETA